MNKLFISALLAATLTGTVHAQRLKASGMSVKDVVPEGWDFKEAMGDLNKDGYADLAIIATPDFKEHLQKREDGYVYNFNQPILAVYWGESDGVFKLYRQYADIIPHATDENVFYDVGMEITNRNVLKISYSTFATGGTGYTGGPTFMFRYQNGNFELIGFGEEYFSRMTGEAEETSFNYSTYKKSVTKHNVFDDSIEPKTTWYDLPREPRKKLGSFQLEAYP